MDRGKDGNVSRRVFLYGAGAVVGGSLLWHWRTPRVIAAVKSEPGEVTIVQFSDEGKKLGKVKIAKVIKTEDEWRKQLTPGSSRLRGTRIPKWHTPENIGICTTRGFFAASVATTRCSVRRRSLIRHGLAQLLGTDCE